MNIAIRPAWGEHRTDRCDHAEWKCYQRWGADYRAVVQADNGRIRDHLRCTDKPAGKDKVHFLKVKSGVR